MPQLPTLLPPDWLAGLTEESIARDPFPLHHILQDSVYYPSCGFDGDPVKHLTGKAYSFIYVDYGHTPVELAQALDNPGFKGYQILGQRFVTERELTPHGWTPVPPPPGGRRPKPSYVKPPFCSWVVLEKKETNQATSGVARFSLLYLCADGAAAYQALYTANGYHPNFVCVIQPGTGFGSNWTDFGDPDQMFARSVKTNPSGTPPYLLFGGIGPEDFYLKPCWPEYSASLRFYQKAGGGTVGVWGKAEGILESFDKIKGPNTLTMLPPLFLPHSNNNRIPAPLFIAMWRAMVEASEENTDAWRTIPLPRRNSACTFAKQLEAGRHHSLDVMLRLLAPPPYRNTMQATGPFMVGNTHLVEATTARSSTGRMVQGARLTKASLEAWNSLTDTDQKSYERSAVALFEADIEVGKGKKAEALGFDYANPAAALVKSSPIFPPSPPFSGTLPMPTPEWGREDFVRTLVKWIAIDPFQPFYRRRPHGQPVAGWGARLRAYFWPTPNSGYADTVEGLEPLIAEATRLALLLDDGPWNADEGAAAVALAERIFAWGGVPQPTPTAQTVEGVFLSALSGIAQPGAPMNSGWTKVASFASAHLEGVPGRLPQVIWDSRVATSITSRLDVLLSMAQQTDPGILFPRIGTVIGRGGTRPRPLLLRWKNGYGLWSAQFAGSALVAEMRDILNEGGNTTMPMPNGASAPWTVRGVEMVLFGDGY